MAIGSYSFGSLVNSRSDLEERDDVNGVKREECVAGGMDLDFSRSGRPCLRVGGTNGPGQFRGFSESELAELLGSSGRAGTSSRGSGGSFMMSEVGRSSSIVCSSPAVAQGASSSSHSADMMMRSRKRCEIQSGVKGVRFDQIGLSWIASWQEPTGRKFLRFSAKKLGFENARGAAIAHRSKMVDRFCAWKGDRLRKGFLDKFPLLPRNAAHARGIGVENKDNINTNGCDGVEVSSGNADEKMLMMMMNNTRDAQRQRQHNLAFTMSNSGPNHQFKMPWNNSGASLVEEDVMYYDQEDLNHNQQALKDEEASEESSRHHKLEYHQDESQSSDDKVTFGALIPAPAIQINSSSSGRAAVVSRSSLASRVSNTLTTTNNRIAGEDEQQHHIVEQHQIDSNESVDGELRYDYGKESWIAHYVKDGVTISKVFSDAEYGANQAQIMAERWWRDADMRNERMVRGVRGVGLNRDGLRWVARWREDGRSKSRAFSCRKLGFVGGRRAAIEYRRRIALMTNHQQQQAANHEVAVATSGIYDTAAVSSHHNHHHNHSGVAVMGRAIICNSNSTTPVMRNSESPCGAGEATFNSSSFESAEELNKLITMQGIVQVDGGPLSVALPTPSPLASSQLRCLDPDDEAQIAQTQLEKAQLSEFLANLRREVQALKNHDDDEEDKEFRDQLFQNHRFREDVKTEEEQVAESLLATEVQDQIIQ